MATRRGRALIRASKPLIGESLAGLGEELRWLGGLLGPVRDLDVLVDHLRGLLATLDTDAAGGEHIVAALEEERAHAQDGLVHALASDRYLDLLDRISSDIKSITAASPDVRLVDIAARQARRLRKAYEALPAEASDAALHSVRIRAKRARYAAELATLTEGKRLTKVVDAAKDLQDLIGEHQDAVVAEERVRGLARARSALAAGRIVEVERDRRRAARAELPSVWRRLDRALARAY